MTNQQAREIFDRAAANTSDPDAIARIEVAREYFTNPTFRKAMEEMAWKVSDECPVCGADCAGANPIPVNCPQT